MKESLERWFPMYALKNLSYITIANFVVYASAFVYGVLGARILGARKYGQLILIISLVRLMSEPFDLQWSSPLIKRIKSTLAEGDFRQQKRSILAVLYSHAAGLILFGLLFAVFLVFVPPYSQVFAHWQNALAIFALSEIIQRFRLLSSFFQAFEMYGLHGAYRAMSALTRNFLPAGFMVWGVEATCWGYLISELLLAVLSIGLLVWVWGWELFAEVNTNPFSLGPSLREMLHLGRSNYLAKLLRRTFGKLQPLVLGMLIGSSEVAYFNVGKKLQKFFTFASKPLRSYLYPRLIEKWEEDRELFYYTLRKYFLQSIPFFSALGLVVAIGAGWFVPFVYGPAFVPSVTVVYILVPSMITVGVLYIYEAVAFTINRQRSLFDMELLRVGVGIPLLLFLTYRYSYLGTALAVTLIQLMKDGYKVRVLWKHLRKGLLGKTSGSEG